MIAALICSAALPVGVPMIVLGATNGIWAVMIAGIVLTVAGFYGTPLLWVSYAGLASYKGVYSLITEDGVTEVDKIASTLGKRPRKVAAQINYLLEKRYLTGYVFDGANGITPVARPKKSFMLGKCPNCGASLAAAAGKIRCPYCGTDFGGGDET